MNKESFEINVLPAGSGDCIHLRFGSVDEWHNVIIDSGPTGNETNFRKLMERISKAGECVDLLCFTHVDDDHINGAKKFLGNREKYAETNPSTLIKEIWMNIPPEEAEKIKKKEPSGEKQTTVDSAEDLYGYIQWHEIPCQTRVFKGIMPALPIGNAIIEVVGPTEERLKELEKEWQKTKRSGEKQTAPDDDSETNGASIILLVTFDGKKMLFCGDAFREDLKKVAEELQKRQETEDKLKIETKDDRADELMDASTANEKKELLFLVKLPHHGSPRNIDEEMLKKLCCSRFIISTKNNSKRPGTETLKLLSDYGSSEKGVTVYANYNWESKLTQENKTGLTPIWLDKKAIEIGGKEIVIKTE